MAIGAKGMPRLQRALVWTALLLAGCTPAAYREARPALAASASVEVLAIGRAPHKEGRPLWGETVIAHAAVTGEERDAILDALDDAVSAGDPWTTVRCFDPHHVLWIEDGDERVMFRICFGCDKMAVQRFGADGVFVPIGDSPLPALLEAPIHRTSGYRFDPTVPRHGNWVR